jgi:hypothetical protein
MTSVTEYGPVFHALAKPNSVAARRNPRCCPGPDVQPNLLGHTAQHDDQKPTMDSAPGNIKKR